MKKLIIVFTTFTSFALFLNCSNATIDPTDSATSDGTSTSNNNSSLPAGFSKYGSNVEAYVDGDVVVIKANSVPTHKSPYFATSATQYEAYNGSNTSFKINPNKIVASVVTYTLIAFKYGVCFSKY